MIEVSGTASIVRLRIVSLRGLSVYACCVERRVWACELDTGTGKSWEDPRRIAETRRSWPVLSFKNGYRERGELGRAWAV